MSGHILLIILHARFVSLDMRSCLGDPLRHSLRPYITTLNFLSIEFLYEAGPRLGLAKVVAEVVAGLFACFRDAAYVDILLLVLVLLLVLLDD